jgi:hypothetical protein
MHAKTGRAFESDLVRPLSAIEEFFYLIKQLVSPTILLTVEIDGQVDHAIWNTAVDAVAQRHPSLRSVVTRRSSRRPALQIATEPSRPLARVFPLQHAGLASFYRAELEATFGLNDAPWRPTLFVSAERSVLALSIDHTISDGRGAALLVQDLLTALTGASLENNKALSPSLDQLLGVPPKELYVKRRVSTPRTESSGESSVATFEPELSIENQTIDEITLQKIAAAAKDNETTVHGALMAAILIAGATLHKPWAMGPVNYISPIDNRPFVGAVNEFGLFMTLRSGEFTQGSSDFWSLARRVRQEIVQASTIAWAADYVRTLQGAMDPALLPEEIVQLFKPWDLMLTNYGTLSIASCYQSLNVRAIRPHVISSPHSQTVSAATIAGTLSLSNVSYVPIPNLLAETKTLLSSL